MIQMTPQTPRLRQTSTPMQPEQKSAASPYIIRRIFYALILMAFFLLTAFYFDILQDYDVLSLLLGFVVCIIIQFSFLSYYFQQQMKKYKMDQIGILKWKIKLIFGQLNMQHVEKKVKMKYYRHEGSQQDRLFSDDNEVIYQNVMTYLRGKGEITFNQLILKMKVKWNFFENKISLMQKFLSAVLKQYESRKSIYNRYKNTILKMKQKQEYKQWISFMKQNKNIQRTQKLNNTSYYSQRRQMLDESISHEKQQNDEQGSNRIKYDWGIMNWLAYQKIKLNQKEIGDIKVYIVEQFRGFVGTIQAAKDINTKKRQKYLSDYKFASEERAQILKDIQKTSNKIIQLQQMLQTNRIKQGEDVQIILKNQFDLRLLKIQLQNYEIKISRANSYTLSTSEQLFDQIEEENRELQNYLDTFNGKINQYVNQMVGYGEIRTPDVKNHIKESNYYIQEEFKEQDMQMLDLDQMIARYYARRKGENSFKSYLNDMLNLFKQLKNNHTESNKMMEQFKNKFQRVSNDGNSRNERRLKIEFNQTKLHYYASSVNDQKILKMFETINSFQQKYTFKFSEIIEAQTNKISTFQEQNSNRFGKQLKKQQQDYKRKQEQVRKIKKKAGKQDVDIHNQQPYIQMQRIKKNILQQIQEYHSSDAYKIESLLGSTIKVAIDSQEDYEKFAAEVDSEEKYELENRQGDDVDDRKKQKFTAYMTCMSKTENQQFDQQNFMKNDNFSFFGNDDDYSPKNKNLNQVQIWNLSNYARQPTNKSKDKQTPKVTQLYNYKQSIPKSLDMINKVLGVLFNQWCNSEFFHEIIKQQLLISLNRKRPDIVENLNIQYFKIVEKQKNRNNISDIKVHQSQIYRCLFDLTLNFKGKIAVQIGTKIKIGKKPPLQIKLMIKQFQCPIRVCFTPFSLGKSYASLLQRPKLSIDYNVTLGGFNLTKIPFFTQIIKTYIVLKLRKKMLWPKRMTLSIPLAFKSTLQIAIQQKIRYQRDKERLQKKMR